MCHSYTVSMMFFIKIVEVTNLDNMLNRSAKRYQGGIFIMCVYFYLHTAVEIIRYSLFYSFLYFVPVITINYA